LANFCFVFFFIKETKGRTLEDMDILFGTVNEEQRAADVERMMDKAIMHEEVEHTSIAPGNISSVPLGEQAAKLA
jgi:hypothetical protein